MYLVGLKEIRYKDMMQRKPDEIIRKAVSGMLPKNKLWDRRLERLSISEDGDMGAFKNNIIRRWGEQAITEIRAVAAANRISQPFHLHRISEP